MPSRTIWRTAPAAAALLLSGLTLAGCARSAATLTEADRALAAATGIPEPLLLTIKQSGGSLRRLEGRDEEDPLREAAGVTIDVAGARALPAVRRLQEAAGPGFRVFLSERQYGIGGAADQVSVLRTTDPFDPLRAVGTNGANYDIGTDAVIERLKKWDAEFGLDLHGAGFDWVDGTFRRPPADMPGFAREVFEFCPDVVEQGTGTVEALADEMRKSNTLYLWWD
ncbi:MAG: DUF4253 domain-containing protein [Candidatus Polarisedimenticolia bacterium]